MIARRKAGSHAPVANPDLARAMHGLRSSSAASPHVPGPRKGTRRSNARRSNARREIREQLR
ncbi:hypothetical protein [Oerskovia enterophila]|uniref:Uncharacterized protein n=1 Tax=Oerskovia enterophila TaxID=43678 RepID=A0ABX2XZ93_9CELL|nr:hypothetical protein [Oerskovia enterophila]OCI29629.1 hypothetical protein OERS_36680 [Oerskovia enterophila]